MEQLDSPDELQQKCSLLAAEIRTARRTVIYTGAGISTAASIPDYRGPQGVWTLMEKGSPVQSCDPSRADPTLTHMAIKDLFVHGHIQHVVSQNCDGLHIRSGLPQSALSEIHGNMYIEVCNNCQPVRQYIRKFDVTQNTAFRRHKSGRKCDCCYGDLVDTIVHFGERGKLPWPLNWSGAIKTAQSADLIICIGTSLQVLHRYKYLWDFPKQQKPKLFIVNLTATPRDRFSTLKIKGHCDEVMRIVMDQLSIPISSYCRKCDPILDPLRRNSRNTQLMWQIANCQCPSVPVSSEPSESSDSRQLAPSNDESSSSSSDGVTAGPILMELPVEGNTAVATLKPSDVELKRERRMQKLQKNLDTWEKYRRGAVETLSVPSAPVIPGWWQRGLPSAAQVKKRKSNDSASGKQAKRSTTSL